MINSSGFWNRSQKITVNLRGFCLLEDLFPPLSFLSRHWSQPGVKCRQRLLMTGQKVSVGRTKWSCALWTTKRGQGLLTTVGFSLETVRFLTECSQGMKRVLGNLFCTTQTRKMIGTLESPPDPPTSSDPGIKLPAETMDCRMGPFASCFLDVWLSIESLNAPLISEVLKLYCV